MEGRGAGGGALGVWPLVVVLVLGCSQQSAAPSRLRGDASMREVEQAAWRVVASLLRTDPGQVRLSGGAADPSKAGQPLAVLPMRAAEFRAASPPADEPDLRVTSRFQCVVGEPRGEVPESVLRQDRTREHFADWESGVTEAMVRTFVAHIAGPGPAALVPPGVVENPVFPWSLAYDHEPKVVRIAPDRLVAQAKSYQVARGSSEYVQLLVGNIAHELGHWYARAVDDRSIVVFVKANQDICRDEGGSYRAVLILHELFADYMAGRILAANLQDHVPLEKFFENVNGRGSSMHPHWRQRVEAIQRGFRDQGHEISGEQRSGLVRVLGGHS